MPSAIWTSPLDYAFLQRLDHNRLNQYINDNLLWLHDILVPVGIMSVWAGQTYPPVGYLLCNGAAVSQTTYAALYAAIGGLYNTGGEGAGNFSLPNQADLATNRRWVIRY